MFIRKSILSLALLGAIASPVFAMHRDAPPAKRQAVTAAVASPAVATTGIRPNNFESEVTTPAAKRTVTREQVQRELAEWRKNPVSGGWREVGGERGWVQEPHRFDVRGGQFVHVDNIPHDTSKPALASAQDKRQSAALYGSGS